MLVIRSWDNIGEFGWNFLYFQELLLRKLFPFELLLLLFGLPVQTSLLGLI